MALIDHPECGQCQEKWQLKLKNLADPQPNWCPGFENYAVTVPWNSSNGQWEYTDGDGCTSYMQCTKPAEHNRIWTASVVAKVGGECICILGGEESQGNFNCLTGGDLTGMECSCLDQTNGNSKIEVTAA